MVTRCFLEWLELRVDRLVETAKEVVRVRTESCVPLERSWPLQLHQGNQRKGGSRL
jgi:hypothetical protein